MFFTQAPFGFKDSSSLAEYLFNWTSADNGDASINILKSAVSKNSQSALLANNPASLYLEKDQDINKAFELAMFA